MSRGESESGAALDGGAGLTPELELASLASALHATVRKLARRHRTTRALPRSADALHAAGSTRDYVLEPQRPARAIAPIVPPARRHAPSLPASAPALAAAAADAAAVRERARACADLASLREAVAGCTACGLCKTRTQTVFADGTARVRVMFVGEAPGESEDLQGLPFVGRAGALLTDIITKGMNLAREDVYIANVLKCRPPGNRDPSEVEKHLCTPWLDRQIELVDPTVIIPLGRHAAGHLLGSDASMGAMRGRVHERGGRKIVPTFHPAFLLRSPSMKKECWKDIQLAMGLLGIERAARRP